ncbi:polyketide cyclase [Kitasatospora sp. NPDC052896]|uniref:polyketide cyclase n=1 Tax=Kitasatospora sp. NPDC052896 TaxID=3364061 RepID=UPI0037C85A1A
MPLNFYRFDVNWIVPWPKRPVFEALTALERFPLWWPDYRVVNRFGDESFEMTLRSTLPYSLVVTHTFTVRDAQDGHFRLALDGDIRGWIDFVVADREGGVSAVQITQECTAVKPLLRALAPVAKPAFRHNHALTMRHGRAGLEKLLGLQQLPGAGEGAR